MKLKYILSAAVLALGITSCSNEAEVTVNEGNVPLQIKTQIQSTRAGIDATQFDNGDQIGVFMQKDGKWSSDCFNVSAATSDYGKSWKLSKEVMLDKTPALLYAYYPWNESVSTEDGISFGLDMKTQTNYLYGFVEGVRDENPVANILFRHALAKVDFLIQNDVEKEISKVTLSGKNLLTTGQFNVTTLSFTSTSTGEIVSKNITHVEETNNKACFLLAPMTEQQLNIRVEYADGGNVYEGTFMASNISMGKHVQYSVNIQRGTEMKISETSIEEWGEAENMGDVTLKESKIDANGREYVDLGLPSGTLWATCNVGASTPEGYGDYFAWGDPVGHDEEADASGYWYQWKYYKWCNGDYKSLTKYCLDSYYGKVDNKMVLDPEDDAAQVNWGGDWRMPSETEYNELLSSCTWAWTTINDVNGYKVSGSNGNWIFLPAAGYRYDEQKEAMGYYGRYWANSFSSSYSYYAYDLHFHDSYKSVEPKGGERCYGYSVRPVLSK